MHGDKFQIRRMYEGLVADFQEVNRRKMSSGNVTRPRALFTLWMAYHEKKVTKDRFVRFGMITNDNCCFYKDRETLNHLFF